MKNNLPSILRLTCKHTLPSDAWRTMSLQVCRWCPTVAPLGPEREWSRPRCPQPPLWTVPCKTSTNTDWSREQTLSDWPTTCTPSWWVEVLFIGHKTFYCVMVSQQFWWPTWNDLDVPKKKNYDCDVSVPLWYPGWGPLRLIRLQPQWKVVLLQRQQLQGTFLCSH